MISIPTPSEFYFQLGERWKQLFHQPSPPPLKSGEIASLTTLAMETIFKHPLSIQELPTLPPSLVQLTLPNGFKICVQEYQNPKAEIPVASIRLVVDAGFLDANEKEIGLPHLVEHGVFQGTKNFTREEIEELFRSLGCKPGADQNATTSFFNTVYKLDNIPTKNQEKLTECFRLFYDFCTSAQFPKDKMIKERGVVLDELLRKQGVNNDSYKHQCQLHFPNSRYAERFSDQLEECIQQATEEELYAMLQTYYSTRYRPGHMTLIIVGDFGDSLFEVKNRNQLIEEIKTLFSTIPSSPPLSQDLGPSLDENKRVKAPWNPQLRTSVFTHSNYLNETLILSWRIKEPKENNYQKIILNEITTNLFLTIFQQSLVKLKNQKESPFLGCTTGSESIKFTDSYLSQLRIDIIQGRALEVLKFIVREFKKFEIYGCPQSLLEPFLNHCKQTNLESMIHQPSLPFPRAAEHLQLILTEKEFIAMSIHNLFDLFFLQQIDKENLNKKLKKMAKAMGDFCKKDVFLTLQSSSKAEIANHQVEELKTLLKDPSLYDDLPPPHSMGDTQWLTEIQNTLLPVAPITYKPLSIESSSVESLIDAHLWQFPNTIEVLYKPLSANSLDSGIGMKWIIPQGLLHQPSRDHLLHLLFAMEVLEMIGLKDQTFSELDAIKLNASINYMKTHLDTESWSLSFSLTNSKGIETALQMLHVRVTDITPILSDEFASRWQAMIAQYKTSLEKSLETEAGALHTAQAKLKYEEHPMLKPVSLEELETLSLEEAQKKAQKILISSLQAFSQSRLIICGGNVDLEQIKSLVAKYIGSLHPISQEKSPMIPLPFTPNLHVTLEKGSVLNRSSRFFYVPIENMADFQSDLYLSIAVDTLGIYLNQKIRKEQQLVYGLQCQHSFFSTLLDGFLTFSLQCKIDQLDSLSQEFRSQLDSILKLNEKELEELLERQKKEYLRDIANQKKTPSYWFSRLGYVSKKHFDPNLISQREEWIKSMTIHDLKKMFDHLLKRREEYKQLTMHPREDLNQN